MCNVSAGRYLTVDDISDVLGRQQRQSNVLQQTRHVLFTSARTVLNPRQQRFKHRFLGPNLHAHNSTNNVRQRKLPLQSMTQNFF